jgi:hypothetical protein
MSTTHELTAENALDVLRQETVLSKLPYHWIALDSPSKDIEIVRKNSQGEVELFWKVKPNSEKGPPGALAYKLDTLLIYKLIDEAGFPVPEYVKLGSLQGIAKRIGGRPVEIKAALEQNAGTLITAKLVYRSKDRRTRTIDATFTRYGVVFTGEDFEGRKADGVYVVFHPIYRNLLQHALRRPLNFTYLASISSGLARRWYEVLSYKIYAAIKNGHEWATIPYSEYCLYTAQVRYTDRKKMQNQLNRVHRTHLESGYITAVRYQAVAGEGGEADWVLGYRPGPRAWEEYQQFNQGAQKEGGEEGAKDLRAELVYYFHEKCRGVSRTSVVPTEKELLMAAELLERGWEAAAWVVEYARVEARRTKFRMRTLCAVRQYVADGMGEYAGQERRVSEPAAMKFWMEEEDQREKAQAYYEALPGEERTRLWEEERRKLFEKLPQAREWEAGTLETTLQSAVLRVCEQRMGC